MDKSSNEMKKRIIIFGATGGTGQHLVQQALDKNYNVTAFVRNPEKLKTSNDCLSIIQGNVLNQSDVNSAVKGQDAVICSLGMPASDKSTLRADGTKNIIKAMTAHGLNRLICQTSLGYGDSKEVLPWHMKYIIVPFILKNAFNDHQLQESLIEKSKLEWTIIRPGNMTNGKKTSQYKTGFEPTAKIKLKVSREDVADFMLSQLEDNQNLYKKVGISY